MASADEAHGPGPGKPRGPLHDALSGGARRASVVLTDGGGQADEYRTSRAAGLRAGAHARGVRAAARAGPRVGGRHRAPAGPGRPGARRELPGRRVRARRDDARDGPAGRARRARARHRRGRPGSAPWRCRCCTARVTITAPSTRTTSPPASRSPARLPAARSDTTAPGYFPSLRSADSRSRRWAGWICVPGVRVVRHQRRTSFTASPGCWPAYPVGVSAALTWHPDPHPGGSRRRMAVPRLTLTVFLGYCCTAAVHDTKSVRKTVGTAGFEPATP